ncbi:CRISPR-associated protein Cas4 [Nocardia sp. CA-084685]|uniref:CRISPR-associated protein Cas4 n=1 Tax=Nocardia sp. CA-084685 TaxID=3239970 RepID=UPI003D98CF0E
MINADDIGGVHIKYLHHCPRQLWLYTRGIRPESLSDRVQLGEAVHDTSYLRSHPIDLGSAKLDHLDGHHWVHEVKSSSHPTNADRAQAMHYCYRLDQIGIDVQGAILKYPKIRRTVRILFNQAEADTAATDIQTALEVITAIDSAPRLPQPKCHGCSYFEYCWTE